MPRPTATLRIGKSGMSPLAMALVGTLGGAMALAGTLGGCGGGSSQGRDRIGFSQRLADPDTKTSLGTPASAQGRPAPIVHLPPHWSASRRVPLVIALHPSGGDPARFELTSGWDRVADEHNLIVAYLGSASPAWKDPANVAYIGAQIRRLTARYGVDPRRVYVTGFSAGAYITYFVGCRLSATVGAIAAVSGAMAPQRCKPPQPVSELTIIGTRDILPLTGTSRFPSPAAVASRWRGIDRCPATAPRVSIVSPVTERTWAPCAHGTAVGFYLIGGGHHAYPGSPALPSRDPDARYGASEAVWAFFAAHPRR
jgi:polyhydroxybutyrate depolymerase